MLMTTKSTLPSLQIHDGDMISGHFLETYINSPAHHTLHHLYFTCNYGQYFTWADSWGGSYRAPRPDLDPIHDAVKNMERKRKVLEREERKARKEVKEEKNVGGEGDGKLLTVGRGGEDSDSGYEGSELDMEEKCRDLDMEDERVLVPAISSTISTSLISSSSSIEGAGGVIGGSSIRRRI